MIILPNDNELDISIFQDMLSYKNMTNSYKLYWFYAIFEEVCLEKSVLKLDELALKMIVKSWYTINQFKLSFGKKDMLRSIVTDIHHMYKLNIVVNEKDLYSYLLNEKNNKDLRSHTKRLLDYVPYRLIRPFYDFKVKDRLVNKMIEELSQKTTHGLYRIDSKANELYIQPQWQSYIIKNQAIIKGWLYHKLVDFLQKRNPNTPAIINKIDPPQQRNLKDAKEYWRSVIQNSTIVDIYTGNEFIDLNYQRYGSLSIDHFIPWSFVLHDEIWNLIPTFNNINSAKNDKLPPLNQYLDKFCNLQYIGLKTAIELNMKNKAIESFYQIHSDLLNKELLDNEQQFKDLFSKSIVQTITPLYQLAERQGFGVWLG